MRPIPLTYRWALLFAAMILPGCGQSVDNLIARYRAPDPPQVDHARPVMKFHTSRGSAAETQAGETNPGINADAEAQADRLIHAMEQAPKPGTPITSIDQTQRSQPAPQSVKWIDSRHSSARSNPAAPSTPAADANLVPIAEVVATQPQTPVKPQRTAASPAVSPAIVTTPATLDRQALLNMLLEDIRRGNDAQVVKAMAVSALSLVDPKRALTADDVRGLDAQQLALVRRFHELVTQVSSEITAGRKNVDTAAMSDHLDRIFGQNPIHIRKVALCRSVSGYGVYEPFDSSTFIAGRDQPMIVYVEVDNYRIVEDGEQYRVRLTQEIELYTDSDGLRVWHLQPEQIADMSRNHRRDFFTVQLVHLPARLGVGKFRMKVRMTDLNGGSFDEWTQPIDFVANSSTASK